MIFMMIIHETFEFCCNLYLQQMNLETFQFLLIVFYSSSEKAKINLQSTRDY